MLAIATVALTTVARSMCSVPKNLADYSSLETILAATQI